MAVKSSGALSLTTDIVGEFGGVAPHSLSEYYGGGTYVPAGANPGIATSGQINMGSFYDAVAATVLTISSNTNNYNIGAAAIAAGGDKSTPVILTINAGVTVGSTSSGTAAMFTGTGWSTGTTINITNNGSIVGANGGSTTGSTGSGGAGGDAKSPAPSCGGSATGSNGSSGSSGTAGTAPSGGSAFEHSQSGSAMNVIFDTVGSRTAGSGGSYSAPGGGGGGGGATWWGGGWYNRYGPGGGGGGAGYGAAGAAANGARFTDGFPSFYCKGYWASAAGAGTANAGGVGGNGYSNAGNGGTGGNLAASGGTASGSSPFYGGAGGSNTSSTGSAGSVLSGNTAQIS